MKGPKKCLVNYMVPNVQFTLQKVLTGLNIYIGPKKCLVNYMVPNVQFTLQKVLTGLNIPFIMVGGRLWKPLKRGAGGKKD
ncbi:unnamed protein product [Clavelina lepadiformis]|uniref:Uncharacterized protein n=1 Tax=Clavelina lepadiformis TaxID=159417 RepID=A0ABP0G748_CLALP